MKEHAVCNKCWKYALDDNRICPKCGFIADEAHEISDEDLEAAAELYERMIKEKTMLELFKAPEGQITADLTVSFLEDVAPIEGLDISLGGYCVLSIGSPNKKQPARELAFDFSQLRGDISEEGNCVDFKLSDFDIYSYQDEWRLHDFVDADMTEEEIAVAIYTLIKESNEFVELYSEIYEPVGDNILASNQYKITKFVIHMGDESVDMLSKNMTDEVMEWVTRD